MKRNNNNIFIIMKDKFSNDFSIEDCSPIKRSKLKLGLNRALSPLPYSSNRAPLGSKNMYSPRWKQMIHPDINQKYEEIVANLSKV